MRSFLDAVLAVALASSAAASVLPRWDNDCYHPAHALYFLTNDVNANAIRALPVQKDGTLGHGTNTLTGGKGGDLHAATQLFSLASQGALQRIGNYLLAVNAGSNTVSMFQINEKNPLELKQMGLPVDSMGDFPNTIAVSEQVPNVACVANSGKRSGVACFQMTPHSLKPMDRALRPLPLDPEQTVPPNGPFNTVSEIFFNLEGTRLWTTVKGDPSANRSGYFGSFEVHNNQVGQHLTKSTPAGTVVLFGSVPLAGDKVFSTDPSFGVAVLDVAQSGIAATADRNAFAGAVAPCWSTYSAETGLAYATDAGKDRITSFNPENAQSMAFTDLENGNPGMFDVQPWGNTLYAISVGNSTVPPAIAVMRLEGTSGAVRAIQNFHPGDVSSLLTGLAIYG